MIRSNIMKGLEFMGLEMDEVKNDTRKESIVSKDGSKGLIFVVPTNEELMIAIDTEKLVTAAKG